MTDKVSVLNLAIMSALVYGNCHEELSSRWRVEPFQEYVGGKYNYRIGAYLNEAAKTIVLANRGTCNFANLYDDLNIFLGDIFKYYQFALDTAHFWRQKYKDYKVLHTGHSLGAAVATLVACVNGEEAIVFESPGIQSIVDKEANLQKLIKEDSNITIYQSSKNIINQCGKQYVHAKVINLTHCDEVMSQLTLLDEELKNSLDFANQDFIFNPVAENYTKHLGTLINYTSVSHSIDNIIKTLKKLSIEMYTIKTGDTLSSIAKNRYGLASEWKRIYEENKATIGSNPNLIQPGKIIQITYDNPKMI